MPILGTIASSTQQGLSTTSYFSIQTATINANTTTVTFDSIPQTYKHLQLRYCYKNDTGEVGLSLRFNSDSANNYNRTYAVGYGNGSVAFGVYTPDSACFIGLANRAAAAATGVTDIFDYTNTSTFTTVNDYSGSRSSSTNSGNGAYVTNCWRSTSAITRIDILASGFNITAGSIIALYGIK